MVNKGHVFYHLQIYEVFLQNNHKVDHKSKRDVSFMDGKKR